MTPHEELIGDKVRELQVQARALALVIRHEVRAGRLTVRGAAAVTGWSSSKVGRVVIGDCDAIVVPIDWTDRRPMVEQLEGPTLHAVLGTERA